MNAKQESIFSGLAVALLLFTSILDPRVSSMMAMVLLVIFSLVKYIQYKKTNQTSKK